MDELEGKTRKDRIDPKLKRAGWSVVPWSGADFDGYAMGAVEEFPTANGPADYALCDNGVALGAVEAKKVTLGPQNVLTQAQRYSRGFTASPVDYGDDYRVPFLYSTNGEVIWFQDIRHHLNRSRKIARFHTPSALHELLGRDQEAALAKLPAIPYHGLLRPYQIECHEAVEDAIPKRKRRSARRATASTTPWPRASTGSTSGSSSTRRPVGQARGRRVRDAQLRRLVQPPPAPRRDRTGPRVHDAAAFEAEWRQANSSATLSAPQSASIDDGGTSHPDEPTAPAVTDSTN